MTKYRIHRQNTDEWLAWDGTSTVDARLAIAFDDYSPAVLFMLEAIPDFTGWSVEAFHSPEVPRESVQ